MHSQTRWYERSFQEEYLLLYAHRDEAQARADITALIRQCAWQPPATVLDLCCGAGRHAHVLCDQGFSVTGVDLSLPLLGRAQQSGQPIRWVHGDMRHVPLDEPFDIIVNLFTSFGYFADPQDDVRVMREIARLLKPRGRCVIDFLNAPSVRSRLVPYSERRIGDCVVEEHRAIEDDVWVTKKICMRDPQQTERVFYERVRLYTVHDFERLTSLAGLRIEATMGDYVGTPYHATKSARCIMLIGHDIGNKVVATGE